MDGYNYEFGCCIDCPYDKCAKENCKYYDNCASCRWFWKCPIDSFVCDYLWLKINVEQQGS